MKSNLKKLVLACLAMPILAQTVPAVTHFYAGRCIYQSNEEYCADVSYDDEFICVAPAQIVSARFCRELPFPTTQTVCYERLAEQDSKSLIAKDCEKMDNDFRVNICLDYIKEKNEN